MNKTPTPKQYQVTLQIIVDVEATDEAHARERAIEVIGNRFYTKSAILHSITADWVIKEKINS